MSQFALFEQATLAEGLPSTVADVSVAANADDIELPKPVGPGYTAAWRQYMARVKAVIETASSLGDDLHEVYGFRVEFLQVDTEATVYLDAARSEIFQSLLTRARKNFAPAGSTLEISEAEVIEQLRDATGVRCNHGRHEHHGNYREVTKHLNDSFDPDAVWQWFESQFGGEAGERLAHRQNAERLIKKLCLHRPENAPVVRRGDLVITTSAYAEKRYNNDGHEYTYGTLEEFRQKLACFEVFIRWAGDVQTANRLYRNSYPVLSYGCGSVRRITSRERLEFGALSVITFLNKFEIVLTDDLGVKFRQYIAEFGAA